MAVDYCKFKLTPCAAAVADVVSLLDQVNSSPGIWYAATDLANMFSLLCIRPDRNIFLVVGKVSIYLQSFLKGTLTSQYCVYRNLDHLSFFFLQSISLIRDIDKIIIGPRDSNYLDF